MVSIDFNSSLIVQLVNFLLLILVLNSLLYKPLQKIIKERNALFDQLRERAQIAKQKLDDGDAEQAKYRSELLLEGVKAQNSIKALGEVREKEILSSAQTESIRRLDEASKKLTAEVQRARDSLENDVKNLAGEIAGRLLGRTVPTVH